MPFIVVLFSQLLSLSPCLSLAVLLGDEQRGLLEEKPKI